MIVFQFERLNCGILRGLHVSLALFLWLLFAVVVTSMFVIIVVVVVGGGSREQEEGLLIKNDVK